ncbi:putative DNA-binding transcriptional regulator [Rubripirellula lacrimiformis]|uniref:Putative DNA-binding transcriptional regulator n=1 Tax=Rubripirellula lacrimiformis TaxID=1930273 RepID=A0A517NH13_9BACT|nr:CerR family C-terminal domain-containing protein [Rubripirellula lacrimiformis]QDT06353.1 putative DNA-binding transcriptional regulator [Rubripirellula lacrimiformis]
MNQPVSTTELDTRARLLDAAGPVFAARGFDRATVREICASAGVNIASVGYHFGDKMGLYRELILQIREEREREFPTPVDTDVEPTVMLDRIIRTIMSRILTVSPSGWESQLFMREMQNPTPVFQDIVRDYFQPIYVRLKMTLVALIRENWQSGQSAASSPSSDPPQTNTDPGLSLPVADHVVEQLTLSVIGQCIYYKVGAETIEILIPEQSRQQHFDIDTICRHITAVTLAAVSSDDVTRPRKQS